MPRARVAALGRDGWLSTDRAGRRAIRKARRAHLALTRETLARHPGLADFAFAMQGLGAGPISLFGSEAQRDAWLPKTRSGKAIAAFALPEPASGSDVANITTTARRDGDGYVIDGEKTWISNGGIADFYVVFARTGEAPGARGLSAFIVDGDNPGLSVAERIDVIAPHPLARLQFHELPRRRRCADRRFRRRLQDRHGDARCFPRHCRRRRARLCPPRI